MKTEKMIKAEINDIKERLRENAKERMFSVHIENSLIFRLEALEWVLEEE